MGRARQSARQARKRVTRVRPNVLVAEEAGVTSYETKSEAALDAAGLLIGLPVVEKTAEEQAADREAMIERTIDRLIAEDEVRRDRIIREAELVQARADEQASRESVVAETKRAGSGILAKPGGLIVNTHGPRGRKNPDEPDPSELARLKAKLKKQKRKPIVGLSADETRTVLDSIVTTTDVLASYFAKSAPDVAAGLREFCAGAIGAREILLPETRAIAFTSTIGSKDAQVVAAPVVRLPAQDIEALVETKLAPLRASDVKAARILDAIRDDVMAVGMPDGYSRALWNLEQSMRGFKG